MFEQLRDAVRSKYDVLEDAKDESGFGPIPRKDTGRQSNTIIVLVSVLNFALLAISTFLFWKGNSRCIQNKARRGYEPLIQAAAPFSDTTVLEGSLWSNSSVFRQNPSPAVDEAWDRVAGTYIFAVPESAILQAGKDPAKVVKAPESWGVGKDMYPADIDGLHQVHCLNALRKDIFYEYYYGSLKRSKFYLAHRAHCIHILLQNLMCKADVDLITMKWVRKDLWTDPAEKPWPDFNVEKKCKDYNALIDWAIEHQIPDGEHKRATMHMPSGESVTDFYEM